MRKLGTEEVPTVSKKAETIAKTVVEGLRKLDRDGELSREGQKVAAAIKRLRKELSLSYEQRHRRTTI